MRKGLWIEANVTLRTNREHGKRRQDDNTRRQNDRRNSKQVNLKSSHFRNVGQE